MDKHHLAQVRHNGMLRVHLIWQRNLSGDGRAAQGEFPRVRTARKLHAQHRDLIAETGQPEYLQIDTLQERRHAPRAGIGEIRFPGVERKHR